MGIMASITVQYHKGAQLKEFQELMSHGPCKDFLLPNQRIMPLNQLNTIPCNQINLARMASEIAAAKEKNTL